MDNPLQIFSEWTDDIETILTNVLENCSLMSEHHKQEYKDLQELFDNSKCKLREEWQEYIKPFVDQLYEFHNLKEMYEGLLNGFTLEKENSDATKICDL